MDKKIIMKNRILICGYPKSGNTWVVRLVAELVNCPVAGFWCEPLHAEGGVEGKSRDSSYSCFKAHHSHGQLLQTLEHYGNGTEKIIYVVRDPRDVVLSAAAFFQAPDRFQYLTQMFSLLPKGRGLVRKICNTRDYTIDYMVKSLLRGSDRNIWLETPWRSHVEGYMAADIVIVRYEDLLKDTYLQACRLLDHLSISRTEEQIRAAIEAQSFESKRKKFKESGRVDKLKFLRKGKSGQFETDLNKRQRHLIEGELKPLLVELGYDDFID